MSSSTPVQILYHKKTKINNNNNGTKRIVIDV